MTLTVKIKNEGNQPQDTVVIRGLKDVNIDNDYPPFGEMGSWDDSVVLKQGEEIAIAVPTGHFEDFKGINMKGHH